MDRALGSRALSLVAALSLPAALFLTACAGGETDHAAAPGWTGTVTTEGNVTEVVNEAGSVWGGTATLVEEASIGVESGDEPYLFGRVTGVWADEQRIYVVDSQVPAVRTYDLSGRHLLDVGRQGEGPGEYREPWLVATTNNGDIVVSETGSRLHIYAPDGTPKQTYNTGTAWSLYTTSAFLVDAAGVAYKVMFDGPEVPGIMPPMGWAPARPDGSFGEPTYPPDLGFEPWCLEYLHPRVQQIGRSCRVPFAPYELSALTPEGAWVVGTSHRYRFEIHEPAGHVTGVEKHWDPVAVSADEIDYQRRRTRAYIRQWEESWSWNGPEIPTTSPPTGASCPIAAAASGWYATARRGASRVIAPTTSRTIAPPCATSCPAGRLTGSSTLSTPRAAFWESCGRRTASGPGCSHATSSFGMTPWSAWCTTSRAPSW